MLNFTCISKKNTHLAILNQFGSLIQQYNPLHYNNLQSESKQKKMANVLKQSNVKTRITQ
jgi:hypothetical protein